MDLELLRTFVAVLESGNFAVAGRRRHITQSTVSLQMKRLAEQAGQALFTALGRRRAPTPAAELLLGYAQRLLTLHDDATRALGAGRPTTRVRLGATQDFADVRLPSLLRRFSASHPAVRLEVRVGSSGELTQLVRDSALDAAVVFETPTTRTFEPFARERAAWLAGRGFRRPEADEPWPLALFDAPCVFRDAALRALETAGIPFRIAYSTPSLGGLLAAARAGLAITLRLARHTQKGLVRLGTKQGLPAVASIGLGLVRAEPASPVILALCSALREE